MGILPSERAIEHALLEKCIPAPGFFQYLVELFLAERKPKRYAALRPQGRNFKKQTIAGYPDAYVDAPEGLHIVEMTVGGWRGHLDEADKARLKVIRDDLKKPVATYVFVTLDRSDTLIPAKNASSDRVEKNEDHYKDVLQGCGVPREAIEFIFIQQLVRELRQTHQVHALAELGLSPWMPPFTRVDAVTPVHVDWPRSEEYRDERVVAPKRLKRIAEKLRNHRVCLLQGPGGVGKTTLGLALGHHSLFKDDREACYADVRNLPPGQGARLHSVLESIRSYNEAAMLFILDNTHLLAPEERAELLALGTSLKGPRLLMLGRPIRENPLASLSAPDRARVAVESLTVDEEDLLAAFRLIARREQSVSLLPTPSPKQLASWLAIAPDLVLFCASLRRYSRELRGGMLPELDKRDAVIHFGQAYLKDLPPSEKTMLAVIASLASLEIPASLASLGGQPPALLLERGLIISSAVGDGGQRFALPHDNLGALLLASLDAADVDAAWEEAIKADLFQATYVVRRLLDSDDLKRARRILDDYALSIWRFDGSVSPGFAATFHRLFVRAGVPADEHIGRLPQMFADYLASEKSFLRGTSSFLNFAKATGLSLAPFDHALASQPEQRLEVALRLASPVEVGHLLEFTGLHKLQTHAKLMAALRTTPVQGAFVNQLAQLSTEEVNQALVGIERADESLFVEVCAFVAQLPLDALFDSVRAALTRDIRNLLGLRHLVELLAATSFRSELADRIGRSFYRIAVFTADIDALRPRTRELVGDAVRHLQVSDKFAKARSAKDAADVLVHVLVGATDEAPILRFINASKWPLSDCMRGLGWAKLEAVWTHLQVRFSACAAMTPILVCVRDVVAYRVDIALGTGEGLQLALALRLWSIVGAGDSARTEAIAKAVRQHRGSLEKSLARLRASEDRGALIGYHRETLVRALA